MVRRRFLVLVPVLALANGAGESVRGKLIEGRKLQLPEGRTIQLAGDADTESVLDDERLRGTDFEAIGRLQGNKLTINPIHTAAIFAHKDGKRLRITFWCDVCAIRTFTPGLCQCCREETVLELREPDKVSSK